MPFRVGPDGGQARDTGTNRHCAAARAGDGKTARRGTGRSRNGGRAIVR
ncbi:hypothetical protein OH687_34810 [Burkholderia anthina]|nr:hypothetical protein OH687_34810 [Burkholderia anthina]